MKKLYTLFLLLGSIANTYAQYGGAGFLDGWKRPNGEVYTMATSGDTAYIGGYFTEVSNQQAYMASCDIAGNKLDAANAKINGDVNASLPDGAGGWYIGGNFTQVNGATRNHLAYIHADGTLDAWNPDANNMVLDMVKIGNTIYTCGNFTTVGGAARTYIAAVHAVSGVVSSWTPGAVTGGTGINTLATDGTTIFFGGTFTSVASQPRSRLASVSASSGALNTWMPDANGTVYALAVSGTTVYIGGSFTIAGGLFRNNVASVDAVTGLITLYDPNVNGAVHDICIGNNAVYVGGQFSTVNNQPHFGLAITDPVTGAPTSTIQVAAVRALALSGNTIYAGGDFFSSNPGTVSGVVAIDVLTGQYTGFTPNPRGNNYASIKTLSVDGNHMLIGGNFNTIFSEPRNSLAAYKLSTGEVLPFNPSVTGGVFDMALGGNTLFFGGLMSAVGDSIRYGVAAVDKNTGAVRPWNPDVPDGIGTMALAGNHIYLGGLLGSVNGVATNDQLCEVDTMTGIKTAWSPGITSMYVVLYKLLAKGDTLYAAGSFTSIGGQTRNKLASFNLATHTLTSFAPNVLGTNVGALTISSDNILYLGGNFTGISPYPRNYMAGIDLATGQVTPFNPNADGIVGSIATYGSTVYAGGTFYNIGGQVRHELAALNASNGLATAWNPTSDYYVNTLKMWGNKILVGGNMGELGGSTARINFVAVTDTATMGPTANIVSSNQTICTGATVLYSATSYNAGTAPTYQWLKNSAPIANATNTTFTTSALANGDVISVVVTSSTPGNAADTSNTITMNVLSATTWTGTGGNTNWSNPANWSCGAVPAAAIDVVIPTGATVVVDIPNATCNNLTVSCCTNMSFSGTGNSLHVTGSMNNNGAVDASAGTLQVDNP